MHATHVVYRRTLLRTVQAGIKNTNPLTKNLLRLLSKNLGSFMRASTVLYIAQGPVYTASEHLFIRTISGTDWPSAYAIPSNP